MPDPGRAVYELWTSPNHAPMPDHLPTLIVTPANRPQSILYTFLHTNYNQENYLLTPSKSGDLCVAKLFPSAAITGGTSFGGSAPGNESASRSDRTRKVVECQASRSLKWSMTNTGIASPTYKLTIPNPDIDDANAQQPLFQVSKPNPHAPFWTLWYYTYAGHLIPPRRVEFGRVEKTAPPGSSGAGGTRVIVTGKTDEEKAVWKTLGDGNEDMVEWIVLCAALNVLDDEIREAAKNAGQPLRPPPAPGSVRANQQAQMVIPPMRRTSRDNVPPPRAKSLIMPDFVQIATAGSASLPRQDQSGALRRPQAPPQQAQQEAYARQQQAQPGGYQPPPRSMEQSMQGLRIDPRAAQQARPSPAQSPMAMNSNRSAPPQQQFPTSPQHMYSPPARQGSAAQGSMPSSYAPRDRNQSAPQRPPQESVRQPQPPNGYYGVPAQQRAPPIQQNGVRRDVSGPASLSSAERSGPPRSPGPMQSSSVAPPSGNPLYGPRSASPLLPSNGPNGSRGPLGPPRPGALQAQSGSIPHGPRKMPSAANLRARSPAPPVDPNILPDSMRPKKTSSPSKSSLPSKASSPISSLSPSSPTKASAGIPDSLKPSRAQPKAPALFEDSELAYAS